MPPQHPSHAAALQSTVDGREHDWWAKQLGREPRFEATVVAPAEEPVGVADVSPSASLGDALDRCEILIAEWPAPQPAPSVRFRPVRRS